MTALAFSTNERRNWRASGEILGAFGVSAGVATVTAGEGEAGFCIVTAVFVRKKNTLPIPTATSISSKMTTSEINRGFLLGDTT